VDIEFQALYDLAEALKAQKEFGYARKLFGRARRHPDFPDHPRLRLTVPQREALCTYKDPDLPEGERFARALELLREVDDPAYSVNQETLGLTGAIYKRLWEVDGQIGHLQRSLGYYRRGYAQGPSKDQGYTAVNTAFVLDLLAREEAREARGAGVTSPAAVTRRGEARTIREELIALLPPLLQQPASAWLAKEWWFLATVAEAHFGLGDYASAREWLDRAAALPNIRTWELESTTRQLATLAQLRGEEARERQSLDPMDDAESARRDAVLIREEAEAWDALHGFLAGRSAGVKSAFVGKVGLALSGGGFRASFFHIGVLAYLAERDALRSVEVLSCVSGGSIVGAHYYLEVRKLLQSKGDIEVSAGDFVDIVRRLEADFLAGVEQNIRSQVLSEFWTNLKAMLWPGYTRTLRLGELYESALYARVNDGGGDKPRYMHDLYVTPPDEPADFKPKHDNWSRRAKVPILVLNATSLNTGHNWQFTASWMGEPPAGIDTEIDGNYRLRRMYYSEAPRLRDRWRRPVLRWFAPIDYRRMRLGHAVAASSCVPGLFEPLVFPNLYPGKTVRLVDGGVHDNQGVASLLEQDCSVLLVSDASGQMEALDEPSDGRVAVPLRAFSVAMARVRQAEYHDLDARRRASLLRGLMFLHLKKDLDEDPVDWVDCDDPHDASDDARPLDRRGVLAHYGIRKNIQEKLAAIRTDLDSFTEVEAFALMTSGYHMAEHEFGHCIEGFPLPGGPAPDWRFLQIEPAMSPGPAYEKLVKRLDVGKQNFLKVWWLSVPLLIVAGLAGVALVGLLVWVWRTYGDRHVSVGTVRSLGIALGFFLLSVAVGPWLVRILRFKRTVGQLGLVTLASLLAALLFKIHLLVFDRLFIRWGRLKQVLGT
jgi:predicted acylesterase/phospholipase RssA